MMFTITSNAIKKEKDEEEQPDEAGEEQPEKEEPEEVKEILDPQLKRAVEVIKALKVYKRSIDSDNDERKISFLPSKE